MTRCAETVLELFKLFHFTNIRHHGQIKAGGIACLHCAAELNAANRVKKTDNPHGIVECTLN